jgi:hypothetical protein
MTPGETGGYEEVLVLRVRRGGRYNILTTLITAEKTR